MTSRSDAGGGVRTAGTDSDTTQRLAERLLEAVATIGYNVEWYEEQAVRAIGMGREFTRRMLVETREWTISTGTNKALERVERAERLLVAYVARRGAIPPEGETMREIVLGMFETSMHVERSLDKAGGLPHPEE